MSSGKKTNLSWQGSQAVAEVRALHPHSGGYSVDHDQEEFRPGGTGQWVFARPNPVTHLGQGHQDPGPQGSQAPRHVFMAAYLFAVLGTLSVIKEAQRSFCLTFSPVYLIKKNSCTVQEFAPGLIRCLLIIAGF